MSTPGIIKVMRNKIQAELSSYSFVKKLDLLQRFVNRKEIERNDSERSDFCPELIFEAGGPRVGAA